QNYQFGFSQSDQGVLFIILTALSLLHGLRGEVLPQPNGGVTIIPHINPEDDPQASLEPTKGNSALFKLNYPRIQIPLEITLWMLLASFAKIGFNMYHKITIWVPETCLLITLGLIVGSIMYFANEEPPAVHTNTVFFLYMLPPIVLEQSDAFFLLVQVVWFALVGTLWNSFGIGISLFAICQIDAFGVHDISLQENLLFASIISAVDPVAMLNLFEDVSVNEQLCIVVLGESIFSDVVTVVLYNMFNFQAKKEVVKATDVLLGIAEFLEVVFGGLIFGIVFGFVAAFTTRFTSKVREIEPLFIFMFSYLAYLIAELFSMSSVTAIVMCAITMKYYVEENVSQRSCTTLRHVIKMLASISETLIFFFLGIATITTEHEWNWGYILFTLLFAFVWRGLGVLVLTLIMNPFRTIPFTFQDQFALAYCGLRGAISFALAFTLPDFIGRKNLFVTTTIALILVTVFIQGITMRPLIGLINIRKTNRNLYTINAEIHCRLMDHTVAGIEDICGQYGHFYWKDKFMRFNDRILRKILIRDRRAESSILALYKKLELQNAMLILDVVSGDISAAPSIISLYEEKKSSSKPNKLLAVEVKKMHDILSKNMYKIRQQAVSFTSKHALPNDSQPREIVIRRHNSIRRSLQSHGFHRGVSTIHKYHSLPAGKSLGSKLSPGRRSHAGTHVQENMSEVVYPSRTPSPGPAPLSSPLREVPSVHDRGKSGRTRHGMSRTSSSYSDSHVPAPRRHSKSSTSDKNSAGNFREPHHKAEEPEQQQRPLSPPTAWAAEPKDNVTQHPLLRQPQWNPKKM
uniref:Sodium/hydrogen exchanger n=1 Tax=Monopterus albus TaxID=43700 RepID=A0A3Q3J363_MONAL